MTIEKKMQDIEENYINGNINDAKNNMERITFKPTIYRIITANINTATWDLLTLDGETPRSTVYFMRKGDAPSSQDADLISAAIENEEWEVINDADIKDFDIDASIFETAGEGYADIIAEILNK